MKWLRFLHRGAPTFGLLQDDRVFPTDQDWEGLLTGRRDFSRSRDVAREDVELLLPIPRPGKIVAVGQNYLDHCREQGKEPPGKPMLFAKLTTATLGPEQSIRWSSALTRQVDFEAELAVVIGKTCRHVQETEALGVVLGYTAANDVSARDLQYSDKQFTRGKGLDTFCPLGPILVEAEDILDPQNLAIQSRLNGSLMQDSSTRQMIFSIRHLIAFASEAFTLEPGEVLLTGTPHGVGVWRDPPIFLGDGDTIEVEIEGIGILRNQCQVTGNLKSETRNPR